MPSDASEAALERLICRALTGSDCAPRAAAVQRRRTLAIELLRKYRTRLIADLVTGKVDVREVAARLPEEPPEDEAESAGEEAMDSSGDAEPEADDTEAPSGEGESDD